MFREWKSNSAVIPPPVQLKNSGTKYLLPLELPSSLNCFKRHLKTHYFTIPRDANPPCDCPHFIFKFILSAHASSLLCCKKILDILWRHWLWNYLQCYELPGTHWAMICVIRCLALTVSDIICLKLGCFQSTSTYSALETSHFTRYINSRLTYLLTSGTLSHTRKNSFYMCIF